MSVANLTPYYTRGGFPQERPPIGRCGSSFAPPQTRHCATCSDKFKRVSSKIHSCKIAPADERISSFVRAPLLQNDAPLATAMSVVTCAHKFFCMRTCQHLLLLPSDNAPLATAMSLLTYARKGNLRRMCQLLPSLTRRMTSHLPQHLNDCLFLDSCTQGFPREVVSSW